MTTLGRFPLVSVLLVPVLIGAGVPIRSVEAQPNPAAMDLLLDRLLGQWRMVGTVRGSPVTYTLDANRVLRTRFVELHMTDVATPSRYEARVFIGVDSANGRYLAHWLDSFGAGSSIPHGTGRAMGDTLHLEFAYPSGLFRDRLVYDRSRDSWHLRVESADSTGWRVFADYRIARR